MNRHDEKENGDVVLDNEMRWDFNEEIQNARSALAEAVNPSGSVREKIWSYSHIYYAYGGELLQTLSE